MRKSITAFLAAAALTASGPVAAQASVAQASQARSGAQMEEANQLNGGYILPISGLVIALLIILAVTDTWPFDDEPASP